MKSACYYKKSHRNSIDTTGYLYLPVILASEITHPSSCIQNPWLDLAFGGLHAMRLEVKVSQGPTHGLAMRGNVSKTFDKKLGKS